MQCYTGATVVLLATARNYCGINKNLSSERRRSTGTNLTRRTSVPMPIREWPTV